MESQLQRSMSDERLRPPEKVTLLRNALCALCNCWLLLLAVIAMQYIAFPFLSLPDISVALILSVCNHARLDTKAYGGLSSPCKDSVCARQHVRTTVADLAR